MRALSGSAIFLSQIMLIIFYRNILRKRSRKTLHNGRFSQRIGFGRQLA